MHDMICDICEAEFEGSEMNEGQDLDGQFTCVCDDCDALDTAWNNLKNSKSED